MTNPSWHAKPYTEYTPTEHWLRMWEEIGMYYFFQSCQRLS